MVAAPSRRVRHDESTSSRRLESRRTGPPRTGGDPLTDLGWLSRSPFDTGCGGPQEVVRHELAVLRPLRDCEPRPRQCARRRAVLPISRLDLRDFATGGGAGVLFSPAGPVLLPSAISVNPMSAR